MARDPDHSPAEYRLLHAAAMAGLFCVGLYAAAFGPVLPFLADDVGVSLDTAGLLLTVFFVGSIAASATIALRLHGHDTRAMTIAGLALTIAGSFGIGFAPNWPLVLGGGIVLGLGDGLIVAALHILVSVTSKDVAGAINRLNLFFAFGAVAGPLWAGAVLATTESRGIVYAGIAGVMALSIALLVAAAGPLREPIADASDGEFALPGNPTAWIMGAVLFLYVGAEFGLGSWVSSYVRESTDATVFTAALLTAGYWAALVAGRIASGMYFARRDDAALLLIVSVAGAGVSSALLAAFTGNIVLSAFAAFGAGLFLGPVWPATVAIASEGGEAHATAATVTIGNSGGIALPWLQGLVLVGAGPREGVIVTAVLCALMLVIASAFRARQRSGAH